MKSIVYLALAIVITLTSSVPVLAADMFLCSTVTEIPEIECVALVEFYTHTSGPGWWNHLNWVVTNTPSDWYGVTVTSGHVTGLDLSGNNLSGILPPEFYNLTYLTSIDFSVNYLGVSLPLGLVNLNNLNYLDLSGNLFSGGIPSEYGNFAGLKVLKITWNANLAGPLPFNLSNLTLDVFWFNNTGLCEPDNPAFQAWITAIPDLRRTGFLCGIGFTCSLVTEIPQAECEALLAFYTSTKGASWTNSSNWMETSLPSYWYGVTVESGHVTRIILNSNHLSGSLPPELGDLIELLVLDLYHNQVTGNLPTELGDLTHLTMIMLEMNRLSGSIPATFGNLADLQYLNLSGNSLSGSIPPEIGSLTNLIALQIIANRLTGSIPSELGNLTNLTSMHLGGNQLTGSIPHELGNLSSLKALILWGNQLSGIIPPELGNITQLEQLHLQGNQLSGIIPAELGNLNRLYVLWVNDNQLTGDIPETLANLNLNYLDLDYNRLNIPAGYPIPGNPWHDFLSQKDPNWHLYQGFEQVIGVLGGELTSLDGRTDFLIPAGALDGDTTFTYMPLPAPRHAAGWMTFANNSFDLSAEEGTGNPVTTFNLPLTVTISYTDTDILGIPENMLGLYYWDGAASTWTDAVTTCPGEYTRNLEGNQLILPICHLTEFGMFGSPLHIFLPVISR